MLGSKDTADLRGGYFLAAGIWLFGVTLILFVMVYKAVKE